MKRLAARTKTAERQVYRRLADKDYLATRKTLSDYFVNRAQILQTVRVERKAAIAARRDDWEQGPLAPRRDTPIGKMKLLNDMTMYDSTWGAMAPDRVKLRMDTPKHVVEERCAWAGGPKRLCLKAGDRVVMVEGAQKGRIAPIKVIDTEIGTVELDDVNMMANVDVPDYMARLDADSQNLTRPVERGFPISAVRLVHPVTTNGVTRDVIIRNLVPRNIYMDKPTRKETWSRIVPGLNIEIPWPKEIEPEAVDHKSDTLRIDVDERTFTPTLLRPPMPDGVIDELRNQYSRFRTRHEDAYIEKLEAKEAANSPEAKARLRRNMETPLAELNRVAREERRKRGQPELTEGMLEEIGKVMAKHQDMLRSSMGVAEVEAAPRAEGVQSVAENAEEPR